MLLRAFSFSFLGKNSPASCPRLIQDRNSPAPLPNEIHFSINCCTELFIFHIPLIHFTDIHQPAPVIEEL